MKIKDMFEKPIDREITGVIKVGQNAEKDKEQELEEYVVTRELAKHFHEFFDVYARSINTPTDQMGVWISGFFGSGKSHFLKILSYILDDEEVDGKRAVDYFKNKKLIAESPIDMGNMVLASNTPTKAILFNVDSKSSASAKADSNAIVNTFNRVFNEKLGYFGANPALADLERNLDIEGKYHQFKETYQQITGVNWLDDRRKFMLRRGKVVEALVRMGYMNREEVDLWAKESTTSNYRLSSDDFAQIVEDYINRTGHRVVFLADEIGQFIATDTSLMLNLQTITEDLGTHCKGKAWVIVTAQEDIDSMVENIHGNANDFSKIQGRFSTRLSLSSVNADEVIRERILKKNENGTETLKALYEQKETQIQNVVDFRDTVEMKKYKNADEFAAVYPFLPYQFNLLASVLNAIRLNSSTGKHLSEGERSMLGAYQEAASSVMNQEEGVLIPFYRFYDDLVRFLDHTHSIVIQRAEDNERINPAHEQDNFTVNVLKTLFLLKYVNGIPLTVNNIVSFMVDNVDSDRIEIRKKVEESLRLLVNEAMVSKLQDHYEFLTDEEQDINRQIRNREVAPSEVISSIGGLITNNIYTDTRYRVQRFNGKYTFAYNLTIDNQPYRSPKDAEIGVRIITPRYDGDHSDNALSWLSFQNKEVILRLPVDNIEYYEEMHNSLQILDYLRSVADPNKGRSTSIRSEKNEQAKKSNDAALDSFNDAIGNADVFVNNQLADDITTKDASAKISAGLEKLVSNVFYRLDYIDESKDDSDIRNLIKTATRVEKIDLTPGLKSNARAVKDMKDYMDMNTNAHTSVSMRSLAERYSAAPYGYIESDIHWLAAKLFVSGQINATIEKSPISLYTKSADDLCSYFVGRRYEDKLQFHTKGIVDPLAEKAAKEISKELFGATEVTTDTDRLMVNFQEHAKSLLGECEGYLREYDSNSRLPGQDVVKNGIALLKKIMAAKDTDDFYSILKNQKNDYMDLSEDLSAVKTFFKGSTLKDIFINKGLKAIDLYDNSKVYITDKSISDTVEQIRSIVESRSPYEQIRKIKDLYDTFILKYNEVLDQKLNDIKPVIDQNETTVLNALSNRWYKDQFEARVKTDYKNLNERAKKETDISVLLGYQNQASAICMNYLNHFAEMPEKDPSIPSEKDDSEGDVTPPVVEKKTKTLFAKNITSSQWVITNEEQLNHYIEQLKNRLRQELEDSDEVDLKF